MTPSEFQQYLRMNHSQAAQLLSVTQYLELLSWEKERTVLWYKLVVLAEFQVRFLEEEIQRAMND